MALPINNVTESVNNYISGKSDVVIYLDSMRIDLLKYKREFAKLNGNTLTINVNDALIIYIDLSSITYLEEYKK